MTVKELFRYLSQDQIVCIGNSNHADTEFMEVPVKRVYGDVLGEIVERVFTTGDILHIYLTGQKPSTYLAECPMCHHREVRASFLPSIEKHYIVCPKCGLTTGLYDNKEVCVDAWNVMCRRCK